VAVKEASAPDIVLDVTAVVHDRYCLAVRSWPGIRILFDLLILWHLFIGLFNILEVVSYGKIQRPINAHLRGSLVRPAPLSNFRNVGVRRQLPRRILNSFYSLCHNPHVIDDGLGHCRSFRSGFFFFSLD